MTQTTVLNVSLDCEACKRKVKKALEGIEGVDTIDVDMINERVTVVGSVEPRALVKKLAKIGKKVELPGNQGGAARIEKGETGKKGGNKNGKNVSKSKVSSSDGEPTEEMETEVYSHIFSDENANGCSIM